MKLEMFTTAWVEAWRRELAVSDDYREAAHNWEGAIVFVASEGRRGDPQLAVYLDLHHGECREARLARPEDFDSAAFVLRAKRAAWERLLSGRLDPIWALMSGKLRLDRGTLADLTPHAKAAQLLLAAARRAEDAPPPVPIPPPPPAPAAAPPSVDGSPARPRFQTTSPRGLDLDLLPMRLFQRAKKIGIWDPRAVDLSRDRDDWGRLSDLERDVILRLTSLFQAGEEAVTLDLLPLIRTIAREGRLEEEMYLTSFLWEEAKHVEAFRRFFDEVAEDSSDLDRYHTPSYRKIFYEELPAALERLDHDPSPISQAEASVTYNMIVEGVLAETGYHAYHSMLERNGILPGMQTLVGHLKSDEARHLAYGVFLLSRLVAEHGEPVWEAVEQRMGELLPVALETVAETFAPYEVMAFGLVPEDFLNFAREQFERRFERISKARHQSLDDILHPAG